MKLVVISDTHGFHSKVEVPEGDVLIHCGDFCNVGTREETYRFANWMSKQPHETKIAVPGNHDVWCMKRLDNAKNLFSGEGIRLLVEEGMELANGKTIWGVPWTPDFHPEVWGFNYCQSGRTGQEIWDAVPNDADILISHGPPKGIRDHIEPWGHIGCPILAEKVKRNLTSELLMFGHCHSGYGTHEYDSGGAKPKQIINAAICTEKYEPTNAPIVWDLK